MKSFVSKLSVFLFGAMFAVGCQDFSEDIREVSANLDKNTTEMNASITNLDAALKALEATHAADKVATEKALADLQTALQGKIKADIEAAEAKLTAAYEAADKLLKETAAADKKELEGKVTAAANAAAAALEAAKNELAAAYKAADQEIKAAYTAADVELKASLQAEINALKEKLEKADSDSKAALEAKIAELDAAYKAADVQINAAIAGVQSNLDNQILAVNNNIANVNTALENAKNLFDGKIADVESHFKAADELLKTELWAELKLYEKAHVDGDKAVKDALEAQLASVKAELVAADAADKKALEDKVDALEAALKGDAAAMKAELDNTIAEIQASIKALDKKYEDEVARVDAAVAALESALAKAKTDLEAAYLAADKVLDAAIKANTELIKANEEAIAKLTERVVALEEADKVLDAAIKAEAKAREEGDADLQGKVDNLATAIEGEVTARTEALAAMAEANALEFARLQGLIEVNAAAIEAQNEALGKANDNIDANKAAIAINVEKLAALEAAYKAADAKIEAAVAANAELIAKNTAALDSFKAQVVADNEITKKSLNTLYDIVDALQADVERRVNALDTEVATLKKAFFTEIDAVKALIAAETAAREDAVAATNKAIDVLAGVVAGDIATLKEQVEEYVAALEAGHVSIDVALADLQAIVDANMVELKTALAEAEAKLAEDLESAKNDLLTAVEAEAAARQASVATINATLSGLAGNIANLSSQVATNSALMEILVADMETIKATYDGFTTGIAELTDRVVDLEADVEELFGRIQSVVYKPTHSDGAARLVYATLGNNLLEGYSYITYKVYPATLVPAIIEKFGKGLELSYDLESVALVKSNEPSLEVKGVSDRLPGANEAKPGELVLKVKASNLGNDFYYGQSKNIYSASLVLTNGKENFSTVYTNLLADNETSSSNEIVMALYQDKTEVKNNATESYSWPYIATVGELHPEVTFFKDIVAKFQYHGKAYTPAELETDFGYVVGYTRKITLSDGYDALNAIKVTVPSDDALTSYVTACPPAFDAFKSKEADMANKVTATYTFTDTNNNSLSVSADVTITDSPYTLKVKQMPQEESYKISYVDGNKSIVVLENEIEVVYADLNGNEKPLTEVHEEYPVLKPKYSVEFNEDVAKLFEITGECWPVTVALKKGEDGKLLAKKEDVGKILNVKYSFDVPVLENDVQYVETTVEITPAHYDFYLGDKENPFEIHWLYTKDAKIDAALNAGENAKYSRGFEGLSIDNPVQNDVKYWALPFGTPEVTYTVTEVSESGSKVLDPATYDINFAGNESTGVANIKMSGFAWNKTYNVKADFKLFGATASAYFSFKTIDRPREDVYVINLPASTVNYVANYMTADKEKIVNALNDIKAWDSILPEENRGEGFDFDKYLKDVTTNYEYFDNFVDNSVAPAHTTLSLIDDSKNVETIFSSEYFTPETGIGTKVDYITKFRASYGQTFVINKTIDFVMPTYEIGYNEFYYTLEDEITGDKNFAAAWGKFTPENDRTPVTNFEVSKIQMLDIFDKIYATGDSQKNFITKDPATGQNVLDKNLKIVYTPVEDKFAGLMNNNILSYNVNDERIYVNAQLFLVNDNGSEIPVATNWESSYAGFYVRKYNPIAKEIEKAEIVVPLTSRGKYEVTLRDILALKDIKNRYIITEGKLNTTNYASVSFYGLKLEYDFDNLVVHSDIKNKISTRTWKTSYAYELGAELTFDYSSDLVLNQGFTVTIPVKYTHKWGEATGEIVVKFVLPSNN